jgi:hypothetical protein
MPRFPAQLRRRIQAQLAAAMLLLAAIFGVAWALSIVAGVFVAHNTYLNLTPSNPHYIGSTAIVIDSGRVLFTHERMTYLDYATTPIITEWVVRRLDKTSSSVRGFDAPRWLQAFGFDWRWQIRGTGAPVPHMDRERHVSVPLWLLIALCAGAAWLLGRRNWLIRRRVIAGLCPACGYDCRATPDHCPECGFRGADEDESTHDRPSIAIRGI